MEKHHYRFLPALAEVRDLEQRLTGLVPGHIPSPGDEIGQSNPHIQSGGIVISPNSDVLAYQRQEQWLDDTLRDSFPASDPVPFDSRQPFN